MPKKTLGLLFVILSLLILTSSDSLAQRPLRRYQPPAGPTITPYLNYYRADWSTMPSSYQSFILPQQRMDRSLYDLSQSQQANFRKVESDIKQVRTSTAAATGVGATFQNYSHYYPSAQRGSNQR
jgi:hypothetical protein